jgi:hypothetical protein
MSTLNTNTDAPISGAEFHEDPSAASVHTYVGDIVVLDASGNAKPGVTATGLIARGVATHERDNSSGQIGDLNVKCRSGVFGLENSLSGDEITKAEIGDICFIVDAKTVAKTSNGGTRSEAGKVIFLEGGLVFVEVGASELHATNGDLLAANNLSEVTPATARANIGANKMALHLGQCSSKAADAAVLRAPAPVAGVLLKLKTVIDAALATADATVQAKINGSNAGSTTTGLVTITQAASAAGDVDSASPVTTNVTLVENDVISSTVGGGSTATGTVDVWAVISY